MTIRIASDYRDYYDNYAWFMGPYEPANSVWYRYAQGWQSRQEQLEKLATMWSVPPHGKAKDLPISNQDLVVIHKDPFAHRGEGKVVMPLCEAQPDEFCVKFISTTSKPFDTSISKRLLCIGTRLFWMDYKNPEGWRSNYGENVEVSELVEDPWRAAGFAQIEDCWFSQFPMWAVDFVLPIEDQTQMLAIDLNTAPGLRGTPIQDLLSPKDVYEELVSWFEQRNCQIAPEVEAARIPRKVQRVTEYLGETEVKQSETPFAEYGQDDWARYWIFKYAQIEGGNHRLNVLDSVMRILYGTPVIIKLAKWDDGSAEYRCSLGEPSQDYLNFVEGYEDDGEYEWETGVNP